ncbi:MAG TPA: PHB depolymerase family esterase [Ktedonobacteraceae bacterium]|nr:PHB depolymerase family esterase [Ktedonobacteraceae bacterium]
MWQHYTYNDPTGKYPYYVYTPANYQPGRAVPLFVMLHGCTQSAQDFATGTMMNKLADKEGFIVVYPEQGMMKNQGRCWNWFQPANQHRDHGEPARIVGIVRELQQNSARWTIDERRIYVAGLSAGGAMSAILGATYPDVFAAIGVHSGLAYQSATNLTGGLRAMRRGGSDPQSQGQAAFHAMSDLARIVPTIVIHGTHDKTVTPLNGDQAVQQWMETNQLASKNTFNSNFTQPTTVTSGQVPGGRAYVVATWKAASGRELQSYWKIGGMGHAWSGGNALGSFTDPSGPSATQAMHDFFIAHSLDDVDKHASAPYTKVRHLIADLFKVRRD